MKRQWFDSVIVIPSSCLFGIISNLLIDQILTIGHVPSCVVSVACITLFSDFSCNNWKVLVYTAEIAEIEITSWGYSTI